MSDSTKSMLSGIYEMGKSVREYIDQNGGGGSVSSSSTDIVFESDIPSMVAAAQGAKNVPHVPTTDTYSAWDSTNNVWIAPKDMTVLVNCTHKTTNDHQHLFGRINVGTTIKAEQGSVKSSNNGTHASINLSAVIKLQAGDEVSSTINVQGVGKSNDLAQQIMTITELGGGGGSSSTSSEVHTIQGEWIGSLNGTQPAFNDLTSGAQYLIGGTVGFGGDMSNLHVQLLSGTIGDGSNNPFSLAAAGEALYDFSHIASFSQIITATGSYHELQFESIGTVTSSVVADYNLYAKKV